MKGQLSLLGLGCCPSFPAIDLIPHFTADKANETAIRAHKAGIDKDVKFAVTALPGRWTFYQFVFLWRLTVSELSAWAGWRRRKNQEALRTRHISGAFCVGCLQPGLKYVLFDGWGALATFLVLQKNDLHSTNQSVVWSGVWLQMCALGLR